MKDKGPVEKIVRSMRSGGLKTGCGFFAMEKDEVLTVKFKDELEYKKLLKLRTFVPATESELQIYLERCIPVVQDDIEPFAPVVVPPADEEEGPSLEPTEEVSDGRITFEVSSRKFPAQNTPIENPVPPVASAAPVETSVMPAAPVVPNVVQNAMPATGPNDDLTSAAEKASQTITDINNKVARRRGR